MKKFILSLILLVSVPCFQTKPMLSRLSGASKSLVGVRSLFWKKRTFAGATKGIIRKLGAFSLKGSLSKCKKAQDKIFSAVEHAQDVREEFRRGLLVVGVCRKEMDLEEQEGLDRFWKENEEQMTRLREIAKQCQDLAPKPKEQDLAPKE